MNKLKDKLTLSLTGHRPKELWGYNLNSDEYKKLEDLLYNLIIAGLEKAEVVECHSGMALGADTVWAQAIVRARSENPGRVTFVAEIPYADQGSKWPKQSKDHFDNLLTHADNKVIYAEKYFGYCMQLRNIGMIDACDYLIAVWDGVIKEKSGTSNAMKYAMENNKKVLHCPLNLSGFIKYNYDDIS